MDFIRFHRLAFGQIDIGSKDDNNNERTTSGGVYVRVVCARFDEQRILWG